MHESYDAVSIMLRIRGEIVSVCDATRSSVEMNKTRESQPTHSSEPRNTRSPEVIAPRTRPFPEVDEKHLEGGFGGPPSGKMDGNGDCAKTTAESGSEPSFRFEKHETHRGADFWSRTITDRYSGTARGRRRLLCRVWVRFTRLGFSQTSLS